jgi:hypothetical protein
MQIVLGVNRTVRQYRPKTPITALTPSRQPSLEQEPRSFPLETLHQQLHRPFIPTCIHHPTLDHVCRGTNRRGDRTGQCGREDMEGHAVTQHPGGEEGIFEEIVRDQLGRVHQYRSDLDVSGISGRRKWTYGIWEQASGEGGGAFLLDHFVDSL